MATRSRRTRHRTERSRTERKEVTRQALSRAALKLLARRSFDALSLREVTRKAGITPTAFYHHFDDMEELGLALVDDAFGSLREAVRAARSSPDLYTDAIRNSIGVVVDYVQSNELHMRFIARERYGGVGKLRRAIHRELDLFTDELAVDLARFPVVKDWTPDDRQMLAGLLVETFVHLAASLLDARPEEHEQLSHRAEQRVRLVTLGTPHWKSSSS